MPTQKTTRKPSPKAPSASRNATPQNTAFPNVSLRWLLTAAAIAIAAALACAWLTLCLLYWQGSWQLLYHPSATITRTPASVGLAFEPIHFAATETGVTQLTGWWLPVSTPGQTVLYLHGADGNLSNTLESITALHQQSLAVFAIDYRGYGQSQPARPNEKQLRQDAEWSLTWLTLTRSIPAKNIVIYGAGLGANLAAKLAADHPELAGVILDQPLQDPLSPVLYDPRSRFVPAHWLVNDLYDLTASADRLRVPSLWLFAEKNPNQKNAASNAYQDAYQSVKAQKESVWLQLPLATDPHFADSLESWLDNL
jgi:pimeloyl-ACP methyl ester carboxylesterase